MQISIHQTAKSLQQTEVHERTLEKHSKEVEKNNAQMSSGAIFAGSALQGILPEKNNVSAGLTQEDIMGAVSAKDAKTTKDMMTVMAASVSPEELGKLAENGFDVRDLDPSEMVNITDEIRATLAKAGVTVPGYNDDLSKEVLTEVTGSIAAAEALEEAFKKYQVPFTEENMKEATEAAALGRSISDLSQDAKAYLIENELPATLENLYTAQHSSQGMSSQAPQKADIPASLIDETLDKYGFEKTTENREMAGYLVSSGIGCTEENLSYYKELNTLEFPLSEAQLYETAAKGLKDKGVAKEGETLQQETVLEKSVRIVKETDSLTDAAIEEVVEGEKTLTLKNLADAQKNLEEDAAVKHPEDGKFLQAKRMLEEVRLSLTVSSTYTLLKLGVSVDTLKLNALIDDLKAVEEGKSEALFADATGDSYRLWKETNEVVNALPTYLEETIGQLGEEENQSVFSYTRFKMVQLHTVSEVGKNLALQYENAGQRYESMQTQVRSDLGDRITNAFRNIPELLKENGFEVTPENEKATRILSRNHMELTGENLEAVKEADRLMTRVIEKMTPGAALKLIREGDNPLQMSLEQLEKKLDAMGKSDAVEGYARFLVRLEERNEITEAEKNSYIGIYRMLHTLEQKDSASLGAVLNQGEELSLKNLLRAVRGRNHAGMDIQVDDTVGFLDTVITKGVSITEQLETAFAESGSKEQQKQEAALFARETHALMEEAAKAPEEAVELLHENNLPENMKNLAAAKDLTDKKNNKLFGKLKDLTAKAERGIDFDSLSKEILRNMDDVSEVKRAYEAFSSTMEDVLMDEMMHQEGRVDLKALQNAFREIQLTGQLAQQEHYEIPMELEGEITQVSVQFKKGTAGAEISYETKNGEHLEIKLLADHRQVKVSAFAESEELAASLGERLKNLSESHPTITEVQIRRGQGKVLNNAGNFAENNSEGTSTDGDVLSKKELYMTAKAVLEAIAG